MSQLAEKLDEETEDKELYDAFTELGSDPEMCDVGFAFQAQAEVALRDWGASFAMGLNPRAVTEQFPACAGIGNLGNLRPRRRGLALLKHGVQPRGNRPPGAASTEHH